MKLLRRILIALVGGSVLLVGVAMIALPGPAVLVIPAGLAILAIEFAWARHWLKKIRQYLPQKKTPEPDSPTKASGQKANLQDRAFGGSKADAQSRHK